MKYKEAMQTPGPDPDYARRIREAIDFQTQVRIDENGRFCQWATQARASTEYSHSSWSAMQASGKPNTNRAGDIPTAWAPKSSQLGEQWLELTYTQPVYPLKIRVHETYNPGAVIKLEAKAKDGTFKLLWKGKDTTESAPAFFEINVSQQDDSAFDTRCLRITLDTDQVIGYNEIDAVELIGIPGPR